MITIFQGRKISLDGTEDQIYANVAVALRDVLHKFNTGKNLNPFAVFMKIALHADKNGWAFPGRGSIKKGTGLSSDAAIASAIKHLCKMEIDGHRVMAWYRAQDPATGQWWWSLYRIFPDAWEDGTETAPTEFEGKQLHLQAQEPPPDNLGVDKPGVGNLGRKESHSVKGTPHKKVAPKAKKQKPPPEQPKEPDVPLPGTEEPWQGPPPPAAEVYRSRVHLRPRKSLYRRIHETVGDAAPDLEFWGEVVAKYNALGWNPTNVDGMLEWYVKRKLPEVTRVNGRGGNDTLAQIDAFREKLRAAKERAPTVEAEYVVVGEAL